MTAFEAWFVKEFGKCPSGRTLEELSRDCDRKMESAREAHTVLDNTRDWKMKRRIALLAWNATGCAEGVRDE